MHLWLTNLFYSNLRKKTSRYLPEEDNKSILFNVSYKKPIVPDLKEIKSNARSRSAKLRYATRNKNLSYYIDDFKKNFQNYFELEGSRLWLIKIGGLILLIIQKHHP